MRHPTQFLLPPGWKLLLIDMGFNIDDVLRLASLPADLFSVKDAAINSTQYFRLWGALERLSDPLTLPLKVGQAISVEAFDPPIFASLCSANLNIALERLALFKCLMGPVTFQVDVGNARTVITIEYYGDIRLVPPSLTMTELVFIVQLVRLATRHRIIPAEVRLPTVSQDVTIYAEYFGIAPREGPKMQISFTAEDGIRPFLTSNEQMWEFFEAGLRKRLSMIDSAATMSERVKAVLLENLPAGQHHIDLVASQLAVSRRTLQRQLNDESTNFTTILNTTRYQLAEYYLKRPAIAQAQIAFLLGFEDINSFSRAFKNWSGISPGVYRFLPAQKQYPAPL